VHISGEKKGNVPSVWLVSPAENDGPQAEGVEPLLDEDLRSLRAMDDLRASVSKRAETPKSEIFRLPC
jgi:hypothetical protein